MFFVGTVGVFLALALLKFGNPVILEHKLPPPGGFWEYLIWSWPVAWGYGVLLVVVALGGCFVRRPEGRWGWMVWLPLAWFVWQCLSATQTVRWFLTEATLKHFAATVGCFYLGLLVLGRQRNLTPMWLGLLVGFIGVVKVGFDQHFGGLEATRQFIYAQPGWRDYSQEFLNKITSDRIYSTLFYPNTLAGVVLLFLPVLLAFILTLPVRAATRWVLAGAVGGGGLGCLYWSGSKAGWLMAVIVGAAGWLHAGVGRRTKWLVVLLIVTVGVGGLFVRHSAYFEKGATSMGARFEYWRAALGFTASHPWLGTGPGTFSVSYSKIRPPEAEPARLAHNDYLEQACDSGIPAFLLFGALILGSLFRLYRRPTSRAEWLPFCVWLGLAGWALHETVEFGLYIPALAWPAFLFLGWLWGIREASKSDRNRIDKPESPR